MTPNYKTIVLNLLRQYPIHNNLKRKKILLRTVENSAQELKAIHGARMTQLLQERPGTDQSQVASETLELAMSDWKASLPAGWIPVGSQPLTLDGAMRFVLNHTPPQ